LLISQSEISDFHIDTKLLNVGVFAILSNNHT